ncbi:hypothetical protein FRC08_010530 [Ceratobasidium sp. 394]|nr:hypothetical protein FRC08_010530 [Ceratobasidium sp. 394]
MVSFSPVQRSRALPRARVAYQNDPQVTYTTERCDPSDRPLLDKFVSGFDKPPAVLVDGQQASPQEMRRLVQALTRELSRQLNGNVCMCIVVGKEGNTVLTTHAYEFLDKFQEANIKPMSLEMQLAQVVCSTSIITAASAESPYPVVFPDNSPTREPRLPPQHPSWIQEFENLLDWAQKVYESDGGHGRLDWEAVAADGQAERYHIIPRECLPNREPFPAIADFSEAHTYRFAAHFRHLQERRSFGSIRPLYFKSVCDENGVWRPVTHDSRHITSPDSTLRWYNPSVQFGQRVERMPDLMSFGSWAYEGIEDRVALADVFMREHGCSGVMILYQGLKEYEDLAAPEAPQLTDAELSSWHPAARYTVRLPSITKRDCDYRFPNDWVDRNARGHAKWSVSAFWTWLASGALRTPTGVLMIGLHGASAGFHTLVHYILNVLAVFSITTEQRNARIEDDLRVFDRTDLSELSRCVEVLQEQLQASRNRLPPPPTPRDHELRSSTWRPAFWQSVQSDGSLRFGDLKRLEPDAWNVFTSPVYSLPVPVESGGEGAASDKTLLGNLWDDLATILDAPANESREAGSSQYTPALCANCGGAITPISSSVQELSTSGTPGGAMRGTRKLIQSMAATAVT